MTIFTRNFSSLKLVGVVLFCTLLTPCHARAEIIVIVNALNKAEIDDIAVARIYLAQGKTFPGGGEAAAVEQKDGSTIRVEFSDKLLKRAPMYIKSYWAQQKFTGGAKPLPQLNNDDAVVKYVMETPSAIGYVDSSKLREGLRIVMRL